MGGIAQDRLLERVARRLQVLSGPARLQLLMALERQPRSVQELADILDRSHQATSRHLNVLFHEGIVDRGQDGKQVVYSLADYTACRLAC